MTGEFSTSVFDRATHRVKKARCLDLACGDGMGNGRRDSDCPRYGERVSVGDNAGQRDIVCEPVLTIAVPESDGAYAHCRPVQRQVIGLGRVPPTDALHQSLHGTMGNRTGTDNFTGLPEPYELGGDSGPVNASRGQQAFDDGKGELRVVRVLAERILNLVRTVRCSNERSIAIGDAGSVEICSRDMPSSGAPKASPTAHPISAPVNRSCAGRVTSANSWEIEHASRARPASVLRPGRSPRPFRCPRRAAESRPTRRSGRCRPRRRSP